MQRIVLIICFIVVGFRGINSKPGLEVPQNESMESNQFPTRIYDGLDSDTGFPFFVGIAQVLSKEIRHVFCGGALISPLHVVTAGHCLLDDNDYGSFELLLGSATQITDAPIRRNISKTFVSPGYEGTIPAKNDIAIILLNKLVSFGPNIGQICVSKKKFDKQPVTLIGYGKTDGMNAANHIKTAHGTTTPCKDEYATSLHICATLKNDNGKQAEQAGGDSGGPLFTMSNKKSTLVGIVAYNQKVYKRGRRLPDFEFPGAYTRVSEYVDWINSVIKEQGTKYSLDTDC